jgi:dTDP-4-amino-4,6-dideoxygalactose transaminase
MSVPGLRPQRSEPLAFARPAIGDAEIGEVVAALRSGWVTTGPRTRAFEAEFAAAVGAPAALALNSCTAALHLGLVCHGIGPGDVVFTTPMTFAATVHVVEHTGATPVLVDVEADTLNLDPAQLERALALRLPGAPPRRRHAVSVVHFAGHPAEMDPIVDAARRHDLVLVEDAAHCLPTTYRGTPVGAVADDGVARAVAFSFYATKNLTTGEGGMLCGTPELIDAAKVSALHGMSRDAWRRYDTGGAPAWFYEVTEAGFKYNMADPAAALGLAQLRRLAEFHARRRSIVARYNDAFGTLDALEVPTERAHVGHAWHLYVLRLHLGRLGIDRDRFIDEMARRRIGTSVHFIPIHLHPYYRSRYGYAPDAFPVAYAQYQRMLSLPLYPAMSDDDVDDVIAAVADVVARHRR